MFHMATCHQQHRWHTWALTLPLSSFRPRGVCLSVCLFVCFSSWRRIFAGQPPVCHSLHLLPSRGPRDRHRRELCRDPFCNRRSALCLKPNGPAHSRLQVHSFCRMMRGGNVVRLKCFGLSRLHTAAVWFVCFVLCVYRVDAEVGR